MLRHYSLAFLLFLGIVLETLSQKGGTILFGNESALLKDQIPAEKPFSMLYFHFKGCPGCVEMDVTTLQDSAVIAFLNARFHNYSINSLSKQGEILSERFNRGPQPAFIFINAQKQEVHRVCGVIEPADFLQQLKYAVSPDKSLSRQKKQAPEKEGDWQFMEWHVRNLDLASTLDSTAIITRTFEAFPERMYRDTVFTRFFMDFAVYEQKSTLAFHSKPYQFFVEHPEVLYASFDTSRVAYVLCDIAGRHARQSLRDRNESEFLQAKAVIDRFWRDNVYFILDSEGDATGVVFNFYSPLHKEREYQYYFKKDMAAYDSLENEFFNLIKDSYQALYFSSYIVSLQEYYEQEDLARRLKYVNQALTLSRTTQLYVLKAALQYRLNDPDGARETLKHVRKKDLKDDVLARKIYGELVPKLQ